MFFINHNYGGGGASGCAGCGGCLSAIFLFGGVFVFMAMCKFFFF